MMDEPEVLYSRMLPGGGEVTIESAPAGGARVSARICVERRSDPRRRRGHAPPVILQRTGEDRRAVLRELYEIAADNVAIARHLLQWREQR